MGIIAVTAMGIASVNHHTAISVVTAAQALPACVNGTAWPEVFTN